MKAKDIMTKAVVTTTREATVKELEELLVKHNISGVPVVDSAGRVVGIVTEADVLRAGGASEYVSALMSTSVVSVSEDTSVGQVARILTDHRIKRVPVLAPDGSLLGIVSRADVVRAFAEK